MISNPFALFAPHSDRLQVCMTCKADGIVSDAKAAQLVGTSAAAGLHQVHGNVTVRVDGPEERTTQADGMITQTPGLALCVRSADCQTFILYDPVQHALGALHAGWRGIHAHAITECITALQCEFNVDPSTVLVGAGPSLCTRCADFSDPANELPHLDPQYIHDRYIDLQQAATDELVACGVPPEQIERHPGCTRCQPDTYWTYRGGDRESVRAGSTNMLVAALTA